MIGLLLDRDCNIIILEYVIMLGVLLYTLVVYRLARLQILIQIFIKEGIKEVDAV